MSKLQITTGVSELLAKEAIAETQYTPQNFVSQIFLVEKKDEGQRPVINLKGLNQFVKTEHFKMEGLHLLSAATGLDGENGSKRCLPLDPNLPRVSASPHFQWEEKNYKFQCLPFGLSAVPRVFIKLLKPAVRQAVA